jgi:hypothetical protein
MDSEGRLIAVCHSGKDAVLRLSVDGKDREVLVPGRPFQFSHHVVIGPMGELYIADGYAKTIWKVEPNSQKAVALVTGEPLFGPVGIALMGDTLLIADPKVKAILRRTPDGKIEPLK